MSNDRAVIPRMKQVAPWMKLIVCMRDPVKRAFSHFNMVVDPEGTPQQKQNRGRSSWVGRSFDAVVNEELDELERLGLHDVSALPSFSSSSSSSAGFAIDRYLRGLPGRGPLPMGHGGHSLVARGLYALQLEPWLAAFPKEQFLFVKMEDLHGSNSPSSSSSPSSSAMSGSGGNGNGDGGGSGGAAEAVQRVMDRVFEHVGLPPEALEPAKLTAKNTRAYAPLVEADSPAAKRLRAFYAPHNARLRDLLGDPSFVW